MRVLLLGATGNVGSRLLPSLVANGHQVVVYVRTPAKLSEEATAIATAVVKGDSLDGEAIKNAILDHNCDALINTSGLAAIWSSECEFTAIFKTIANAAIAAHEQRGGEPLRAWFLSGFSLLDSPKPGYTLLDYVPVFPSHTINYNFIKAVPQDKLRWSLFCANYMPPAQESINYAPIAGAEADKLVAGIDSPPDWYKTLHWVPLLGNWLNIFANLTAYTTPLEMCTDFMARDLTSGAQSPYVGKRVAVKVKAKSA